MSQLPLWDHSAPQLKLFDDAGVDEPNGQSPPGCFSPRTTLGEFYDAWIRPVRFAEEQLDRKTIAEYDRSIDLWVQLTGDPPLEALDLARDVAGEVEAFFDAIAAKFLLGLQALRGKRTEKCSAFTVKRRMTNVQTCLRYAGPLAGRSRGRKIIVGVPVFRIPPTPIEEPEGPRLSELKRIIDAAEKMKTPKIPGVAPPIFWQSLTRFAFQTSERRGALLGVRFSDVRPIDDAARLPGCEPVDPECTHEMRVPGGLRKGHVKRTLFIPLNPQALEAIEAMRSDTPREVIFAWPHCLEHFAECWKTLVTKHAGLPDESRLHFHRVRSTAISEATELHPMCGQLLAGHSTGEVTMRHYQQRKLLRRHLMRMPRL